MRFSNKVKSLAIVVSTVFGVAAQATPITFSFNYLDGAGEGFNNPVYGSAAKSALEFAGAQWGSHLSASYVGETIHVDTYMNPLGTGVSTLASASPTYNHWNIPENPTKNTIFADALGNHISGKDLATSKSEITVKFNTDQPFYFGTDYNAPNTQYNFVSLAMHEMGHGLGFSSRIDHDNSDGSIGAFVTTTSSSGKTNQYASIYDRFLVNSASGGTFLTDMTDAQRSLAITGGSLFWSGANAVAANGGVRPSMYAPSTVSAGSSVVHFDPKTHFLLDYNLARGEDVRVDTVTLGALADMGWNISPVPEPETYAMMLVGLGLMGSVARRRKHAKS